VRLLRESFAAKLLAALLGTVGLLLMVTFVVVRAETSRQVDAVVQRTISSAETLFEELTELQRQQAFQLARPFMERRDVVRLDDMIQSGDFEYLSLEVDYEMNLAGLTDALLVFTDSEANPVLTMIGSQGIMEGDPADVSPMARRLLDSNDLDTSAYRLVGGALYNVTSLYIEDAGRRPVGTITFGLPVDSLEVQRISSIGGFQACFFARGSCVVATDGVRPDLRELLEEAATTGDAFRTRTAEGDIFVRPEPLMSDDPSQGARVIAIPLSGVVQPFARIERALLLGGGGALLLSALFGAALSRSLTRPIRALVEATSKVADGEYETEVGVTTRDEVGKLTSAFNEMTRGLLVRERYRAVLNKVVSQDVAEELMRGEVELGGESRSVSVLFADIRGFTPLTENMEPQEVIGLLNDCMEHLSDAIDAEGGVVDKFIGDEVMAVFGAPADQDDHALRAVSAALRMREGMAVLNARRARQGEAPLAIGVGINSGVAVAGNMGSTNRMNYTVVGDMVNLASRLAGQAGPGDIYVSGATLGLAGDTVVANPVGGRTLKGFTAEVEVYAVRSLGATPRTSSQASA